MISAQRCMWASFGRRIWFLTNDKSNQSAKIWQFLKQKSFSSKNYWMVRLPPAVDREVYGLGSKNVKIGEYEFGRLLEMLVKL
jgi:hypothetical protein